MGCVASSCARFRDPSRTWTGQSKKNQQQSGFRSNGRCLPAMSASKKVPPRVRAVDVYTIHSFFFDEKENQWELEMINTSHVPAVYRTNVELLRSAHKFYFLCPVCDTAKDWASGYIASPRASGLAQVRDTVVCEPCWSKMSALDKRKWTPIASFNSSKRDENSPVSAQQEDSLKNAYKPEEDPKNAAGTSKEPPLPKPSPARFIPKVGSPQQPKLLKKPSPPPSPAQPEPAQATPAPNPPLAPATSTPSPDLPQTGNTIMPPTAPNVKSTQAKAASSAARQQGPKSPPVPRSRMRVSVNFPLPATPVEFLGASGSDPIQVSATTARASEIFSGSNLHFNYDSSRVPEEIRSTSNLFASIKREMGRAYIFQRVPEDSPAAAAAGALRYLRRSSPSLGYKVFEICDSFSYDEDGELLLSVSDWFHWLSNELLLAANNDPKFGEFVIYLFDVTITKTLSAAIFDICDETRAAAIGGPYCLTKIIADKDENLPRPDLGPYCYLSPPWFGALTPLHRDLNTMGHACHIVPLAPPGGRNAVQVIMNEPNAPNEIDLLTMAGSSQFEIDVPICSQDVWHPKYADTVQRHFPGDSYVVGKNQGIQLPANLYHVFRKVFDATTEAAVREAAQDWKARIEAAKLAGPNARQPSLCTIPIEPLMGIAWDVLFAGPTRESFSILVNRILDVYESQRNAYIMWLRGDNTPTAPDAVPAPALPAVPRVVPQPAPQPSPEPVPNAAPALVVPPLNAPPVATDASSNMQTPPKSVWGAEKKKVRPVSSSSKKRKRSTPTPASAPAQPTAATDIIPPTPVLTAEAIDVVAPPSEKIDPFDTPSVMDPPEAKRPHLEEPTPTTTELNEAIDVAVIESAEKVDLSDAPLLAVDPPEAKQPHLKEFNETVAPENAPKDDDIEIAMDEDIVSPPAPIVPTGIEDVVVTVTLEQAPQDQDPPGEDSVVEISVNDHSTVTRIAGGTPEIIDLDSLPDVSRPARPVRESKLRRLGALENDDLMNVDQSSTSDSEFELTQSPIDHAQKPEPPKSPSKVEATRLPPTNSSSSSAVLDKPHVPRPSQTVPKPSKKDSTSSSMSVPTSDTSAPPAMPKIVVQVPWMLMWSIDNGMRRISQLASDPVRREHFVASYAMAHKYINAENEDRNMLLTVSARLLEYARATPHTFNRRIIKPQTCRGQFFLNVSDWLACISRRMSPTRSQIVRTPLEGNCSKCLKLHHNIVMVPAPVQGSFEPKISEMGGKRERFISPDFSPEPNPLGDGSSLCPSCWLAAVRATLPPGSCHSLVSFAEPRPLKTSSPTEVASFVFRTISENLADDIGSVGDKEGLVLNTTNLCINAPLFGYRPVSLWYSDPIEFWEDATEARRAVSQMNKPAPLYL